MLEDDIRTYYGLPEDMAHDNVSFSVVLEMLKAKPTRRFARKGWNGRGMYISLQIPDRNSKMTLPYIYMKTADGRLVPWLASQTDMLAEDWSRVYYE